MAVIILNNPPFRKSRVIGNRIEELNADEEMHVTIANPFVKRKYSEIIPCELFDSNLIGLGHNLKGIKKAASFYDNLHIQYTIDQIRFPHKYYSGYRVIKREEMSQYYWDNYYVMMYANNCWYQYLPASFIKQDYNGRAKQFSLFDKNEENLAYLNAMLDLSTKFTRNKNCIIKKPNEQYFKEVDNDARQAFYTQQKDADFIVSKLVTSDPTWIIDPCCGSGNLLIAARKRYPNAYFLGLDIENDKNRPEWIHFMQADATKDLKHSIMRLKQSVKKKFNFGL